MGDIYVLPEIQNVHNVDYKVFAGIMKEIGPDLYSYLNFNL